MAFFQGRYRIAARAALIGGALLLAVALALALAARSPERAEVQRMPHLLPRTPSIALVPLVPVSAGREAALEAQALSAHLVGTLGALPGVFVIGVDSSLALPSSVSAREVAERFAVQYVLLGRLREGELEVALDDALAGKRLWAERFAHEPGDPFAALAQAAFAFARSIGLALNDGQRALLARPPTRSAAAWQLHVRARAEAARLTREANAHARALWQRATEYDPRFDVAWVALARAHVRDIRLGWSDDLAGSLARAEAAALRALLIDPISPGAYLLLGAVRLDQWRFDRALEYGRKSLWFGANDPDALAMLAVTQNALGRPEEAARLIEEAMRRNPHYPAWYLQPRAESYRLRARYTDAIRAVKEELARLESAPSRLRLAIYYAQSGLAARAGAEVARVLEREPKLTLARWAAWQRFRKPYQFEADRAALAAAGLPAFLSFECPARDHCT